MKTKTDHLMRGLQMAAGIRPATAAEARLRESRLIHEIAKRAVKLAAQHGKNWQLLDAAMDIEAAHNDCPLDLDTLLGFDDANFGHDVFGINRFLDRDKIALTGCFVPRCALSDSELASH